MWISDDEIERLVDDELRRAKLTPTASAPVTAVEAFVEGYLGCVFDQYGELPPDVLGLTEFRRGSPPVISINRDLTGVALDDDDSPIGLRGVEQVRRDAEHASYGHGL